MMLKPRHIIHGGAGAITPEDLPPPLYRQHAQSLLSVSRYVGKMLDGGATALDAACEAVRQMEDCDLWNCGKGAVFTRNGHIELEASVMVSSPISYPKRTCAVALLKHTKNPVLLAKAMLQRSAHDLNVKAIGGGTESEDSAQGHCCLSGIQAERLGQNWGLDMVPTEYFWTKKRWDQHRRGLKGENDHRDIEEKLEEGAQPCSLWREKIEGRWDSETLAAQDGWNGLSYLPQGTVGCVCLDRYGMLCVATSTGGLTNKLDGRIGDTPTVGAGYWANEWIDTRDLTNETKLKWLDYLPLDTVRKVVSVCLPSLPWGYNKLPSSETKLLSTHDRAVAMSGTGNGDSFLRLAACRSAAAMAQYSPGSTLALAIRQMAGPRGELQRSAMDRWGKHGEGEGGIIGIELVHGAGKIIAEFNCGGMFRCWVDEKGYERVMVFRDEYPPN